MQVMWWTPSSFMTRVSHLVLSCDEDGVTSRRGAPSLRNPVLLRFGCGPSRGDCGRHGDAGSGSVPGSRLRRPSGRKRRHRVDLHLRERLEDGELALSSDRTRLARPTRRQDTAAPAHPRESLVTHPHPEYLQALARTVHLRLAQLLRAGTPVARRGTLRSTPGRRA